VSNSLCWLTTWVTLDYGFWQVLFQYTLLEQDSQVIVLADIYGYSFMI